MWAQSERIVQDIEQAIRWIKSEENFPGGSSVIFANLYEYTDGTGDTTSCELASAVGLSEPVTDPALEEMVLWISSEYMRIATQWNADMIFLLEHFCGHGFHHDNPEGRCYLGPDAEMWFDNTCVHPNPTGHEQIANMFFSVIEE